ncbi:MAG: hypothetical protein Q4B54_10990, partial [Coriobacteriales bacterium]|nr:hypothetical protein [Coriobacteriales bacterium]
MAKMQERTDKLFARRKQRRVRYTIAGSLAVVVALATTVMLLQPAATLKMTPTCGMEEHVHTDACFANGNVCTIPEHTHTKECYENSNTAQALAGKMVETGAASVADKSASLGVSASSAGTSVSPATTASTTGGVSANPEPEPASASEQTNTGSQVGGAAAAIGQVTESVNVNELADNKVRSRIAKFAAIVRSQVGTYAGSESTGDYDARYGNITDDAFGRWNALFAIFCLNHAGIAESVFPRAADAGDWNQLLVDEQARRDENNGEDPSEELRDSTRIYAQAGDETFRPQEGDLVFTLAEEDGGSYVCVGIVLYADYELGELTVVEGDVSGEVQQYTLGMSYPGLLGYGVMPAELRAEWDAYVQALEEGNASVKSVELAVTNAQTAADQAATAHKAALDAAARTAAD